MTDTLNARASPLEEESYDYRIISGGGENTSFSSTDILQMQNTLAEFSQNMLLDPNWKLHIPSSHRDSSVSFPNAPRDTDSLLLRALVLHRLSYASPTVSRSVKEASWILDYFSAKQVRIENCRTSTVQMLISSLEEDETLTVMQKNSIMSTLGTLVDLCVAYGLAAGSGIIDCSHRWKEKRLPKRAPDACVVEQLDSYFFDPGIDIPLQYRTIYILLRLISNRISEVLFMPIECITYPDVGIYSIGIPTQKETPYHIPEFHQYPKKLSGQEEGYLYSCLRDMQDYANSQQSKLKNLHQGLLFVSPTGKTLVTTSDVNAFLKEICEKYQIKDAAGEQACITTHDLRHTAVVERFKYGIISPYQTMRESNHSSIDQTCGYGYASLRDESAKLAKISKAMFSSQYAIDDPKQAASTPRAMAKKKFAALCEDPNTRLLLDGSACINKPCVPLFETCSTCDLYHPDPIWREPLEEYIGIYAERIKKLETIGGNPNTISFLKHQKDVYERILRKIKVDSATAAQEVS